MQSHSKNLNYYPKEFSIVRVSCSFSSTANDCVLLAGILKNNNHIYNQRM